MSPITPGTLYGIGTGPGDPELMTLKAVRLLRSCPVVAYFAKRGGPGQARRIVASHLDGTQHEVPMVYPVTTELPPDSPAYAAAIEGFFDESAERLASLLAAGQSVAVLNEGDPFFYGSYMHLHLRLAPRFTVEVVPGVPSLLGCAAQLPIPLTIRDDVLSVIPGTLGEAALAEALSRADAAAVMKLGSNLPKVRRVIESLGLTARAWYVERGTTETQRVHPLAQAPDVAPYFAMILIPGQGKRGDVLTARQAAIQAATPEVAAQGVAE
ncbi:precorrin-2 C(20)-methyltransferase [Nitrospirillum sp. BR 11752]|uniref:precorrin-2 C(20)-methyltransferase n=1 Tax=Nitrospirillum sp. BR 11752 TaxID=3104293 RepID=UPI002EB7666C|nr:precorrin-2 C(20)-methyltransferase [Nitrospirillum sp. BR 11752]